MAVLANPRHERFAQELARGVGQSEAYVNAGYNDNRSAACRLAEDVNVRERVASIQQRAAIRSEITVASITDRLLAIALKAEASNEAPMLQTARASLMDAAKLNGLVIDQSKIDADLRQTITSIELIGVRADEAQD